MKMAALLFLLPASLLLYKPLRVLMPEMAGVSCVRQNLCTDDPARLAEAEVLYREAFQFVDSNIGKFKFRPKVVFCASQACYRAFGFDKTAAEAVETMGIVIGPRAWQPYYVRHEMIHHLQAEHLGWIGQLTKPKWFIEGMAYSLSGDPRTVLRPPFQGYRAQFQSWYAAVGLSRLWSVAADL